MFEDLGEQEHVFQLLDGWVEYPRGEKLTYETGQNSEIIRRLDDLLTAITVSEKKTIDSKPERNLHIGFSYESKFLCELSSELIHANTPAKLKAKLIDFKIDLLKAMVIGCNLKHDGLEFKYKAIQSDATIGKARKKQVKEWSADGVAANTKYSETDKLNWQKEAELIRATNKKLSNRSIAKLIKSRLESTASIETIRKVI